MARASTAARLAAIKRDKHGRPLSAARSSGTPYTGDANGGNIAVGAEIYLGGLGWVDISPYIYYRDGSTKVSISRGRPDESAGSLPPPQSCSFQLNNRGAHQFSPRNPTGPYYGLIGRNTPIRFWRMQNGIRRYRYAGEMPAWPSTADITGTDVYTPVTAYGMLRRLGQGTPPIQSVMYRAYTLADIVPNVVAYWPCEDGSKASQIASAYPGGSPMSVSGSPTFASSSVFACSQPLPVINNSSWQGPVGPVSSWTDNVVRFLLAVPSGGDTDGAVVARFTTTGTVKRVDLVYNTASGGELTLKGYDAGNNALFTLGPYLSPSGGGWNGVLSRVSMQLVADGANVDYQIVALQVNNDAGTLAGGTLAGASIGAVNQVIIDPNRNLVGTAVGHISVQSVADSLGNLVNQMDAFNFDSAPGRLERLCTEQGVNQVSVYGDDANEASMMGNQSPDTFLNLLKSCVDVDAGMLFEARDQVALALRQRWTLYNQGTSYGLSPFQLTLDYSQHQLSGVPSPIDDDLYIHNDVTVSQTSGTSARQTLSDGSALSVSPPPVGVGEYATTYPLNVGNDGSFIGQSSIADEAGWRLHLGTVNEPRFPRVSVNLRHPAFQNNLALMNAALSVDIGDLIVINNPDAWLSADPIRLLIIGMSETIGAFEHDIVFTCVPESPYRIFVPDDPVLGRADTDGSTLAAPAGATDTTLSVSTTNPASPQWTTADSDFPFDIDVGGERITVTSIGTMIGGSDGTFESGVSGWSTSSGTFVQSSAQAHSGTFSGLLTPDGVTQLVAVASGFELVTAGAMYYAAGWFYMPNAYAGVQLRVNWFSGLTGAGFLTSSNVQQDMSAGVWTPFSAVFTAPNGANSMRIEPLIPNTPPAADVLYIDSFVWYPLAGPQIFSVTRSVNGVVKSQTQGTDVRLWQPSILSL
jgi:hypothetical protein